MRCAVHLCDGLRGALQGSSGPLAAEALDPMPAPPAEPSAAPEVPFATLQPSLTSSNQTCIQQVSCGDASDEVEMAPETELTQGDLLLKLKVQRQVERAMTPRGQHLLPQATCPVAATLETENLHVT